MFERLRAERVDSIGLEEALFSLNCRNRYLIASHEPSTNLDAEQVLSEFHRLRDYDDRSDSQNERGKSHRIKIVIYRPVWQLLALVSEKLPNWIRLVSENKAELIRK